MSPISPAAVPDPQALVTDIRRWSAELGFAQLGVAHIELARDEAHFLDWLRAGFNGEMAYMARHGVKRSRPAELLPRTVSCISVRMDYWPGGRGGRRSHARRPHRRVYLPLRAGARLPQAHACTPAASLRSYRERRRSLRLSRIHRQRTGFGEGTGAQRRLGLDRQAHQSHRSRRRIVFFPRRNFPEP